MQFQRPSAKTAARVACDVTTQARLAAESVGTYRSTPPHVPGSADEAGLPCYSEGSVVADYYLLLNNLVGELTTQDVNVLFQEKLRTSTVELPDGREQKVLQMGSLSIDPGFTDFIGEWLTMAAYLQGCRHVVHSSICFGKDVRNTDQRLYLTASKNA